MAALTDLSKRWHIVLRCTICGHLGILLSRSSATGYLSFSALKVCEDFTLLTGSYRSNLTMTNWLFERFAVNILIQNSDLARYNILFFKSNFCHFSPDFSFQIFHDLLGPLKLSL